MIWEKGMKNAAVILSVIAISLVLCVHCCADTIVLKGGQRLTGDILLEKEAELVIDIGAAVLSIPKEKILEYNYSPDSKANGRSAPSADTVAAVNKNKLYRTAQLKETTIENSVEAIAEAVVKVSTPAGLGSGFFLNEDGYLITNYHVIEGETRIKVTVFEKEKDGFKRREFKKVKIEAINPFVDLALLKVEGLAGDKVKYACLGDIDLIKAGQTVFAIGNPLGLERTVTDGVISTKNRAFEGLVYIQTNADINPGNSGGPLFNLKGEVVGVTNMGYIFFGGLGFAIPVNYVKDFINNRDVFAYDKDNPNTGYKYLQPDKRRNNAKPKFLKKRSQPK